MNLCIIIWYLLSIEIDLVVAFVNKIVKCKRVKRTMIKLPSLYYRKKKITFNKYLIRSKNIDCQAQGNECVQYYTRSWLAIHLKCLLQMLT